MRRCATRSAGAFNLSCDCKMRLETGQNSVHELCSEGAGAPRCEEEGHPCLEWMAALTRHSYETSQGQEETETLSHEWPLLPWRGQPMFVKVLRGVREQLEVSNQAGHLKSACGGRRRTLGRERRCLILVPMELLLLSFNRVSLKCWDCCFILATHRTVVHAAACLGPLAASSDHISPRPPPPCPQKDLGGRVHTSDPLWTLGDGALHHLQVARAGEGPTWPSAITGA
jgi:hypothetical protein